MRTKMLTDEAQVVVVQVQPRRRSVQVLDHLQHHHHRFISSNQELAVSSSSSPLSPLDSVATAEFRSTSPSPGDIKCCENKLQSTIRQFIPSIRSGSFADIGPRRYMEDEHIRIDDLCTHLGPLFSFPEPSAFYGIFDGHGGPEAAAYVRNNVMRFFLENAKFCQTCEVDDDGSFLELKNSLRKAFLAVDLALADDCNVSSSSGTTALTALVLGRVLLVANAGDCRAVLSRKGEAFDMSQDHRPIYASERVRVEELGGYVDDGYLNGILSVSRALGDWDMKYPPPQGGPLIAEPEFAEVVLTEDDEFLIIGCDGIWDVMSSQHAVSVVRLGLQRHDDPQQCARDLVMEALRLNTFDNLTVIVVCFSSSPSPPPPVKDTTLLDANR